MFTRYLGYDGSLDDNSVSNYAKMLDRLTELNHEGETGKLYWENIFDKIKDKGKGKRYNCIIGVSGPMATKSAILGTHGITVNTGTKYFALFQYISDYKNLFYFDNEIEAVEKRNQLLRTEN